MSGIVALTSRRVTSQSSPKHRQVLSSVGSGSIDRCENCRSVKLVKPLSLVKCCLGCFCQVVWAEHAFVG